MSENGRPDAAKRSLTTRRGFVAAASLGAVSLYGLWAAFGAAPFRLFGGGGHGDDHEPAPQAAGHGEHGAPRGPDVDEFRKLTDEFIARHKQADGSVLVGASAPPISSPPAPSAADHGAHGSAHDAGSMAQAATPGAPADVYLIAQRFSYEPAVLRLRADAPYRFRMMAVDAAHGASIQLGRGSRIIRLRQGVVVEQDLTFTRPGEYLVYCTIYCGIGHHLMNAKILVS